MHLYQQTNIAGIWQAIKALIGFVLSRWWLIMLALAIGAGLGFLASLKMDDEYESVATFAIEGEQQDQMMSGAMSLANQFGLSGALPQADGLTMEYLHSVSTSSKVLKSALLDSVVYDQKKDLMVNHYIEVNELDKHVLLGGLPEGFRLRNHAVANLDEEEDRALSIAETHLREKHFSAIVPVDMPIEILSVRMEQKDLAIALNRSILDYTVHFFTSQRNFKARERVRLTAHRVDSLSDALAIAEYRLADWQDTRNRMVKAKGSLKEFQLLRQVELLNLLTTEAIANAERAKVDLIKNQAVITIIDAPETTIRYFKYTWLQLVLIGAIAGAILCVLSLLIYKIGTDAVRYEQSIEKSPPLIA